MQSISGAGQQAGTGNPVGGTAAAARRAAQRIAQALGESLVPGTGGWAAEPKGRQGHRIWTQEVEDGPTLRICIPGEGGPAYPVCALDDGALRGPDAAPAVALVVVEQDATGAQRWLGARVVVDREQGPELRSMRLEAPAPRKGPGAKAGRMRQDAALQRARTWARAWNAMAPDAQAGSAKHLRFGRRWTADDGTAVHDVEMRWRHDTVGSHEAWYELHVRGARIGSAMERLEGNAERAQGEPPWTTWLEYEMFGDTEDLVAQDAQALASKVAEWMWLQHRG